MKVRTNNSYSSLEEIIEALSKSPYPELTWVGRSYSKADLIRDLTEIKDFPIIAALKANRRKV